MAGSVVSEVNDGPVLNLMNKRLRALRKKYNRIIQMEEALSQGKTLNKEQEEVLRSKPGVVILIDEYEKLRQPLSVAVQEEINQTQEVCAGDLVKVISLGSYVKEHSADGVSNDLLAEKDLDMISELCGLIILKPGCLPSKKALESCIHHAKYWLSSSEQLIQPGTATTYSGVRESVNKILSSDYLTTAPEVKAPVEVVAAAATENSAVPVEHFSEPLDAPVEVAAAAVPAENSVEPLEMLPITREIIFGKCEPAAIQEQVTGDGHSLPVEELAKDESEILNQVDATSAQQEENKQEDVIDQNQEEEWKEHHSRRSHQRGRGGVGGRRGSNGRGGRSNRGGGGFYNGRGQNYDQPGNYNPRNYNNSRGRGGRGAGGNGYNNNHASADQGHHAQAGVDC
ncbi:hypothetical protein MKW94_023707 [Papaver nudicaule]|uniref:Uncharacterized protein n=1 Tax=Papaver nudicaule TaxID=74823 RepID=A0AA41VFV8_PAPNU|nr:hypothetical protein [Papaver nudicaule]